MLAGTNVTFSVTASGDEPLNYQWKKNGTNVSGTTAASLVLTNVKGLDSGNYNVAVSNAGGAVTSAVAVLVVDLGRPMLTISKSGTNVTMSWPLWGTNFTLLSATSVVSTFTPAGGSRSTNVPQQTVSVTLPMTNNPRFFLLRR